MGAKLINISGGSGVGKTTIIHELQERHPDWHRVKTLTTRPHAGGNDDPSYDFVDQKTLERSTATGNWIITEPQPEQFYATSIDEIRNHIREGTFCIHSVYADENGAQGLRRIFGNDLISIGLLPCTGTMEEQLEELKKRLQNRGREPASIIEERMKRQAAQLLFINTNPLVDAETGEKFRVFDTIMVNDIVSDTADQIEQLLSHP